MTAAIYRYRALAVLAAVAFTVHGTYIESVAANVDGPAKSEQRKHEPFVPLVAFKCGFRNKHMNKDGEWQDDASSAGTCLEGKYDILKYCKRVYPGEEITNIVEYSHMSHIDKWCREESGNDCKHQHTVRPYRCIIGEFQTESLQVPSKCQFSHVAGRNKCNDYKFWSLKAESECGLKVEESTNQSMKLRSFAILEPCGLSMFRGVEFVCCPKSVEDKIEKVVDLEKDTDEDDYDDEEEEDTPHHKNKDDKEDTEQDPYFKDASDDSMDEHERFRDAEERLEKKHRRKVTKVITEWSELFERYNKMKEKDPKGAEDYKREMTSKFRKTVAALEEENKEQRTQIEELHDERVQASLNEKKRTATHDYRAALAIQVGSSNKNNVLKTLKAYIKAEEKDRTHMLNRYRHLLRSDPEEATTFEPVLLHRLRYIDLRINGTLAMLRDFPSLEKQIRPLAVKFWHEYRKDNTPEVSEEEEATLLGGGDEKNERLIRLYKQTYERNHPGVQLAFLDVKAAAEKKATSPSPSTVHKAHKSIIPLKDVLAGKAEMKEDSDEDQFEEDEEVTTTTKKSKTMTHEDLLPKSKTTTKTSAKVEDENADDEDDLEEDGYLELNDKSKASKEHSLTVAIEPILPKTHVEDADDIDSPQAYGRHDLLVAESDYQQSYVSKWASNTQVNFALALLLSACIVLGVSILMKRRHRHPGFIEVDVCTPEERHVNGLQINGYENPTYTFFDGNKA